MSGTGTGPWHYILQSANELKILLKVYIMSSLQTTTHTHARTYAHTNTHTQTDAHTDTHPHTQTDNENGGVTPKLIAFPIVKILYFHLTINLYEATPKHSYCIATR